MHIRWFAGGRVRRDSGLRNDSGRVAIRRADGEGFVALGLSSNGGVDAILFHELGMSSVVNFVREYKGTLTRSSPHAASQGDVARLTGRNALPPDGRGHRRERTRVRVAKRGERRVRNVVLRRGRVRVERARDVRSAEIRRLVGSVEESSMYTIGDTRVALVERVNLDVLNVTTMTPTAASDVGGNAVTITVVGALGSAFTDDGVLRCVRSVPSSSPPRRPARTPSPSSRRR